MAKFTIKNGVLEACKPGKSEIRVDIPEGVKVIAHHAFRGCYSIKTVIIPNTVKTIESYAFCEANLHTVVIPDSVKTIGVNPFNHYYNHGLERIDVDPENRMFSNDENGVLFNKDKTELISCPSGIKISEYSIPETVTSIADKAFNRCGIKTISIPDSVIAIGNGAFSDSSIEKIRIPNNITELKIRKKGNTIDWSDGIFSFCNRLKAVIFPEKMKSIGEFEFLDCKSLKRIVLPDNVVKIEDRAFEECRGVTYLEAKGLQSLGRNNFCSKLKEAVLPGIPLGEVKDAWIKRAMLRGFLNNRELYSPESAGEYRKYYSSQKKKILPDLFKEDNADAIKYAAEEGIIKESEFSDVYLIPAEQANARKCLKILNEWAKINSPEPKIKTSDTVKDIAGIAVHKYPLKPDVCFPMGKNGTWWRVLDVDIEKRTVLAISEYEIAKMPYNNLCRKTTWEACSLRAWLNGEYYKNSFSEAEKDAIKETECINSDNPHYGTEGGNTTKDKIFLLSLDEAEKYFTSSDDRAVPSGNSWWLRSPGHKSNYTAVINSYGMINPAGHFSDSVYAIRPALYVNLESDFFKQLIATEPAQEITVDIPDTVVYGSRLVSANPKLRSLVIPEGVEEIAERCFADNRNIREITLPSTLKIIGAEAFSECGALENIHNLSDSVSWGRNALGSYSGNNSISYTSGLFRTKGKLCESFLYHLDKAGDEDLAWMLIYQSGKEWNEKLQDRINACNAKVLLNYMQEHISALNKLPKKEAGAACNYIKRNASLLDKESVMSFIEILKEKKCENLAEKLLTSDELSVFIKDENKIVLSDGTTLMGSEEIPFAKGSYFPMGKEKSWWKILEIDEGTDTALVISEYWVGEGLFNEGTQTGVTWEESSVRAWLNGEYYNSTFSDAEKHLIMETEVVTPDNTTLKAKGIIIPGGNPTKDKLFLLSSDEAGKYFKNNDERELPNPHSIFNKSWLLRTNHTCVDGSGNIYTGYSHKVREAIRPAMRVDLKGKIKRDTDGNKYLKVPQYAVKTGIVTEVFKYTENLVLPSLIKAIGSSAVEYCEKLKTLDWENKKITIDKNNFYYCPNLRLPADLYITEKKLDDNLAEHIPNDPKAIAYVITYQNHSKYDRVHWPYCAAKAISEDTIAQTVGELKKLNPNDPYPEWILAAAPYAGSYANNWNDQNEQYKTAISDIYSRNHLTDKIAAGFEHSIFMDRIVEAAQDSDCWNAPYAVFANEEETEQLIRSMKTWHREGNDGKTRLIKVRGALLLNKTTAAMRYFESLGQLDLYAEKNGTDADSIRDTILSDFGLDEAGRRSWTLAGKKYTATLNKELNVTIEDETGKEIKSLPKRGADPEEYEKVKAELSSLKKDIRSAAKLRNDRIFADFLSGRKREGKAWKDTYLRNPLLKNLARLVVWEQEGNTFVLREDGKAYDVNGNEYDVSDSEIAVAHPMDMSREETKAWQEYFINNGLKQPFEQVWEPVVDLALVKKGRYDGCTIELYMLMNKEKHGINMIGQSKLELKECSAGLKPVSSSSEWIHNEFEVTDFSFDKYSRQVNHIVVLLDKGTVEGRIKKDDVSVRIWLDNFTAAQIRRFIDVAAENKASDVTALLLEYQQTNYAGYDPFAEFTLEL